MKAKWNRKIKVEFLKLFKMAEWENEGTEKETEKEKKKGQQAK